MTNLRTGLLAATALLLCSPAQSQQLDDVGFRLLTSKVVANIKGKPETGAKAVQDSVMVALSATQPSAYIDQLIAEAKGTSVETSQPLVESIEESATQPAAEVEEDVAATTPAVDPNAAAVPAAAEAAAAEAAAVATPVPPSEPEAATAVATAPPATEPVPDPAVVEEPVVAETPEPAPEPEVAVETVPEADAPVEAEVAAVTEPEAVPEVEAVAEAVAEGEEPRIYLVAPGDSLASIALEFYGDPQQYQRIINANQAVIDSADTISIGQELLIPR